MLSNRIGIIAITLLLSLTAAGCGHRGDNSSQTQTGTQPDPQAETEAGTETETGTATATFIVTTTAAAGGSITPASVAVISGASAVLTVTPNSGFNIEHIVPTGCAGTLAGNVYTTGPITADCVVAASFVATTEFFTVTASAGGGGSITPTSVAVPSGTSAVLTITPDTGFTVAGVMPVGCTGALSGNTYVTAPITAHCAITASFAAVVAVDMFTVSASAGAGGSITPGSVNVTQGASAVLSVTPDAGFRIASVTASGCSGTLVGTTYTTGPITAPCAVAASFAAMVAADTFTVTANAGAGGSIAPGSVGVVAGATTSLTVTANTGFTISSVTPTGCTGTLVGNIYTTDPITAHCIVVASFVANTYTVTASAGAGGSITPASASVTHGASAVFTVTPESGFSVASVSASGCSGTLAGSAYTTGPVSADCAVTANFAVTSTSSVVAKVATGGSHTCALTSAGAVQCWGDNFYGELGNGSTSNSNIPVTVAGLSGEVTAVAAGAQHTCALTRAGTVQCWGYNRYGQMGNGSTTSVSAPVVVTGLSGTVTMLAAGSYHTCALNSAGAVQCWGYNANGQLGNGSTTNVATPVTVAGISGSATALVAGSQHTCALTSAGTAQCWGNNLYGQLGNGSTANTTTPLTVTGLSGSATLLAAGSNHTCALTSTGVLQCWGLNASGQLGDGSIKNSAVPATVAGLSGSVATMTAGNVHTCAVLGSGAVQCWGGNNYGQLGDGATANSSVPVTVAGLSGAASALAAGYGHNCTLTSAGAAQCWGYNLYGQLGNGSTVNSPIPVSVTGLSGSVAGLM